MNQQDPERWRGLKNDAFDRQLDAVLSKLATVEPNAGLEDRIFANLRIRQKETTKRSWWRWPAVAALAAVIVVTVSLVWRSGKPTPVITTQHPLVTTQTREHAGAQVANKGVSGPIPPHETGSQRTLKPYAVSPPVVVVVHAPKLDQFPSPQPLSEQEKILAGYVTEHRRQAILVARARMAELRKDLAEVMEMDEASTTSNHLTSDQPVNQ
jgi:hypothetical protein